MEKQTEYNKNQIASEKGTLQRAENRLEASIKEERDKLHARITQKDVETSVWKHDIETRLRTIERHIWYAAGSVASVAVAANYLILKFLK